MLESEVSVFTRLYADLRRFFHFFHFKISRFCSGYTGVKFDVFDVFERAGVGRDTDVGYFCDLAFYPIRSACFRIRAVYYLAADSLFHVP